MKQFIFGVLSTVFVVSLALNAAFYTGKLGMDTETIASTQPISQTTRSERDKQILSVFDPVDYPTKYAKAR